MYDDLEYNLHFSTHTNRRQFFIEITKCISRTISVAHKIYAVWTELLWRWYFQAAITGEKNLEKAVQDTYDAFKQQQAAGPAPAGRKRRHAPQGMLCSNEEGKGPDYVIPRGRWRHFPVQLRERVWRSMRPQIDRLGSLRLSDLHTLVVDATELAHWSARIFLRIRDERVCRSKIPRIAGRLPNALL